jgi:hypothetical protein
VPGARVINRGDKLVPDSVVVAVVGRVLALALRRGETVARLSRGDVENPVVAVVAEADVRGEPTAGAMTLGIDPGATAMGGKTGVGGGGRLSGTNGISPWVGTVVGMTVLAAGERAAGEGAAMALGGRPRRRDGADGATGATETGGATVVAARAGRPRRRGAAGAAGGAT